MFGIWLGLFVFDGLMFFSVFNIFWIDVWIEYNLLFCVIKVVVVFIVCKLGFKNIDVKKWLNKFVLVVGVEVLVLLKWIIFGILVDFVFDL